MRITLVHAFAFPEVLRGGERYLDDLASTLAKLGHQVEIIAGTSGRTRVEHRTDGVTLRLRHHLPPGPADRFGVTREETFGVRALLPLLVHRADIVHALTPSAVLAGRLSRTPTVYTLLGHPVPEQLPVASIQRHLLRAAVRHASLVACYSAASARAARSAFGCRAVVLTPGVQLDRFPVASFPRVGPPRILFPNSLGDRRKRADVAVAAMAAVLQKYPEARLVLMGEGDPSWALANADASVRAAVDIVGPVAPDAVASEYQRATVSVLPSQHEAFGIVLLESLASGTPVVCAPGGGMTEIVAKSSIGRVAKQIEPDAIASAILDMVPMASDPATPQRCHDWAARWSWEVVGREHEHCYEALLDGREPESSTSR